MMVMETVSEKFVPGKKILLLVSEKIWYRKKYRYRYQKYLLPEESVGIGMVWNFGYCHTLLRGLRACFWTETRFATREHPERSSFLQPMWKIVHTEREDEWIWCVSHKERPSTLINGTLMAKVNGLPLLRVAPIWPKFWGVHVFTGKSETLIAAWFYFSWTILNTQKLWRSHMSLSIKSSCFPVELFPSNSLEKEAE